jgi:hypothetical protein
MTSFELCSKRTRPRRPRLAAFIDGWGSLMRLLGRPACCRPGLQNLGSPEPRSAVSVIHKNALDDDRDHLAHATPAGLPALDGR